MSAPTPSRWEPTWLDVRPDDIPLELRALPAVLWRAESRGDGKPTKVPYQVADPRRKASSTDPSTWGSFDDAVDAAGCAELHVSGVGVVLTHSAGITCIDLDHVIEADGRLDDSAVTIVKRCDSWTEKSPSGTGLHVFVLGMVPHALKGSQIEVYSVARYIAVTGHRWPGTPAAPRDAQTYLNALSARAHEDGARRRPYSGPRTPAPDDLAGALLAKLHAWGVPVARLKAWAGRLPRRAGPLPVGGRPHDGPGWGGRDDSRVGRLRLHVPSRPLRAARLAGVSRRHGVEAVSPIDLGIAATLPELCYIESLAAFLAEEDPPSEMIFPDLLPRGVIMLLHGEPRSRKSLAAFEFALSAATGTAPFGLKRLRPLAPVTVAYIQEEDPRSLTRPWLRRLVHERCGDDMPDTLYVSVRRGLNLDDPAVVARLIEDLKRLEVRLLVLDAARRLSIKTDEGPAKVRELIAVLRAIVTTSDVTIVIVHHDTKSPQNGQDQRRRSQRASGGDWFAGCECPVHVERVAENETLVFPQDYKFSTDPAPFTFRCEVDGGLIARLVGVDSCTDHAGRAGVRGKVLDWLNANGPASKTAMKRAGLGGFYFVNAINACFAAGTVSSRLLANCACACRVLLMFHSTT
jgi:AAA domain-containing protein